MTPPSDQRIAVIGLGYVGLPLAIAFAEAGLEVEGDRRLAGRASAELNAGALADRRHLRRAARRRARRRPPRRRPPADARLAEADAIFVCVPTPITTTKDPDLGPVLAAAALIREHAPRGPARSSSSRRPSRARRPGPFREVARAERARAPASTSTSPSRPSGSTRAIRRAPRRACRASSARRRRRRRARAAALLAQHQRPASSSCRRPTPPRWRSSSRTSSATSTSRSSTSSRCCASGWASTSGRSSTRRRPSRSGSCGSRPGPGVGGHCIPVDPYYLSWRAREFDFIDRFIELAGDINFAMPRHVVDLVAEALNDRGRALAGAKVGVLGVAFKPNVRDARNSPAADVIAGHRRARRGRRYHDPHVPTFRDATGTRARDATARRAPRLGRRDRRRHRPPGDRLGRASTRAPTSSSTPSTAPRGRDVRPRQVLRLGAGWSGG